jgi:hypothetical protein
VLRYCSPCNGFTRNSELSRFCSGQGVRKTAFCFAGRDRHKAFGSRSDMGIEQQQACQTEPNRSLFTWSSRRCMLIDRGMI